MGKQLLEPKETYTIDYPKAIAYAEAQQDIFWTANEIEMEKDLHGLRTDLSEAEFHAVTESLKLFTLYELKVGDYWLDYVFKTFKRPDIQRMASVFGFFELNVHAPFYNKINEVLGINTDEFYESYKKDKELKARMDWLDNQFGDDVLYNVGLASMIEGAILYSNFAFFKHFQAQGKNKLMNLCAGINFSVRDENLHSEAGAWLFKTLLEEEGRVDRVELFERLREAGRAIYKHECKIIDMLFSKGNIKGITSEQMKHFMQSRINLVLEQLSIEKLYTVTYDPISGWFYKNINSGSFHDFFVKQGNNYNRDWREGGFIW
jgi:ribonucleotide reductase beta subunit family protein with ferritin-like domain